MKIYVTEEEHTNRSARVFPCIYSCNSSAAATVTVKEVLLPPAVKLKLANSLPGLIFYTAAN